MRFLASSLAASVFVSSLSATVLPNPNVFLTERVQEADPDLKAAFLSAWEASQSFREMVSALYCEQPKIRLILQKMDSESFGDITLTGDSQTYPLVLDVQWRGVRRGIDVGEPWLASLLYALLEVSRKDNVISVDEQNYNFSPMVRKKMWNFQAKVRRELKKSDPEKFNGVAPSGEHLYWNIFPPRPRLNRD